MRTPVAPLTSAATPQPFDPIVGDKGSPSASREPLLDCVLSAQELEEAGTFEHLAYPCGRIDHSYRAVDGSRHPDGSNQLADAGGIDSGHPGKIHDYATLSTTEQRVDALTQRPADGHVEGSLDVHDVVSPGR